MAPPIHPVAKITAKNEVAGTRVRTAASAAYSSRIAVRDTFPQVLSRKTVYLEKHARPGAIVR